MGERVKIGQFKANIDCGGGGEEEELEMGLPTGADLAPLCQLLIPQGLASAFGISPPQNRTAEDVDRASERTVSSLQNVGGAHAPSGETAEEDLAGSDPKKPRTMEDGSGHGGAAMVAAVAGEEEEGESATGDPAETRTASKRQRLVWTPELQRRFLDVVGLLGVKNAVPKTIMQMMNVEGLTRENVASHLQKYRIYLKQKQGFSDDATSSSSSSSRGILGNAGGRLPSVGPPYNGSMLPVQALGHMAMQGYHHHHLHHHYHHHHSYNSDNPGHDPNHHHSYNHGHHHHSYNSDNPVHDPNHHQSYHHDHGGGIGFGSNPHKAEQNGSGGGLNSEEEDSRRL